ncbi:MAG: PIN domain-containing protein [Thermofilaceae archaeon]
MLGESSVYPDGVLDVSVVVVACFDNPLRTHAVRFLSEVLTQRRRAALPVSAVIGAYHIATRYLRVERLAVKRLLEKLLETRSPAFYPQITPQLAIDALEYAAYYNVEAWDGYLVSLARSLGTSTIYSLDKELARIREVTVVNPFPEEAVRKYHEFVRNLLR